VLAALATSGSFGRSTGRATVFDPTAGIGTVFDPTAGIGTVFDPTAGIGSSQRQRMRRDPRVFSVEGGAPASMPALPLVLDHEVSVGVRIFQGF
jgi:hypothetical protein